MPIFTEGNEYAAKLIIDGAPFLMGHYIGEDDMIVLEYTPGGREPNPKKKGDSYNISSVVTGGGGKGSDEDGGGLAVSRSGIWWRHLRPVAAGRNCWCKQ
ncbi:unnamed protein product [Cuscuta epithymum]|uniref:Uncharacterized protein n=1 Tax=Cuscuta epithymum TaxID=186058 RepID=A0AAV0ESL1_9ASTE|nr:unnamed protein product [Cuscuta epithymum]